MMKGFYLFVGVFLVLLVGCQVTKISSQCGVQSDSGVASGSYKCPNDVDICDVSVVLSCQNKVTDPKVVLRYSDFTEDPAEIAVIDPTDNDRLVKLVRSNTIVSYNVAYELVEFPNFHSASHVQYRQSNNEFSVCYVRTGLNSISCRRYVLGGNIPTDLSPTEPYASSSREVLEGNVDIYSCSQKVSGGLSRDVSYSGAVAGEQRSSFTLVGGQGINWDGRIEFVENDLLQSECTKDMADLSNPNRYFKCLEGGSGCGVLSDVAVACNPQNYVFDEFSQSCKEPYRFDLTLSKKSFSTSEGITGQVVISDTSQVSLVGVVVVLKNNLGVVVGSATTATNQFGVATFTLPAQSVVGGYSVEASSPNHPLGTISDSDFLTVSRPITVRLAFPSGVDRVQYTSDDVKVNAFVTDGSGNPAEVRQSGGWDFSGTNCGGSDLGNSVIPVREASSSEGVRYLLNVGVSKPCLLTVKASAVDPSGFKSQPDSITVEVREAQVLIQPDLGSVQDKDEGRYSISFKTLDANLQPLSTQNSVVVTDSDGCDSGKFCLLDDKQLPSVVVNGVDGQYGFSYTFKDGLNTIKITSIAENIQPTTQEFIVNFFPKSSQDPVGGGVDGDGFGLGLIFTAVVVVIAIVLFYFLAIRRK